MGYFKRRSILLLIPTVIIALIIGTPSSVMASGGTTNPIAIIPGNMDFVFMLDASKEPIFDTILGYMGKNNLSASERENEFYPRFLNAKVVLASTAKDIKNSLFISYIAVKTSKSMFEESLEVVRGIGEVLTVKNDPYTYYCNQSDSCYSYIGGYYYETQNEDSMRILLTNYYKKSFGSLAQNSEFLEARSRALSQDEVFFFATKEFFNTLLKNSHSPIEDSLQFGTFGEFLDPLQYLSISIDLNDRQLQVRVFEQLDESALKTLGIALKDYMFKPHLYSFFDPSGLMMLTENHNLAGKVKLLKEHLLTKIAIPVDVVPLIELGEKLSKGYAFGMLSDPEGGLLPTFHFIAEIKQNDERAIGALLDEIFTLTKTMLEEEMAYADEDTASQYSFTANPDDTYTFSMTIPEDEQAILGETFDVNFGLDNGYLFLSTLTDEASTKKYAYADKLKRLFGNSSAMHGLFYLDFKNVNSTVSGIVKALDEAFGFSQTAENEVFINTLGSLGTMIVKSFSTEDSVTADFILTLQEDATLTELTDTIIGLTQTTEEAF